MRALDVVIVNWNSREHLRNCLHSVQQFASQCSLELHITVVDNGSTDRSADDLPTLVLEPEVFKNETNRGFAAACNQGASVGESEFILFLNPDTKLSRDSLEAPVAYLGSPANARVGIVGIQLLDTSGRKARTCSRFPTLRAFLFEIIGLAKIAPAIFSPNRMTDWDHSETRLVDEVMGAFFLVRRKVYEELGGFDERFFVYFEEVDFSYRARLRGWSSVYLADASASHWGGGSSERVKDDRLFYSLRSRILYAFKHFSLPKAYVLLMMTLLIEPITRIAWHVIRGSWTSVPATIRGYMKLLRWSSTAALRTSK